MESSLCEKPERHAPRRLSDHLGLEGLKQKVHSLVDKVYSADRVSLIPSLQAAQAHPRKLDAGKLHVQFERRTEVSAKATERASSDPTLGGRESRPHGEAVSGS
jgi:hypothetical protein